MRQATGSNRLRPAAKGVSIQLALDGHSFSMPAAEACAGAETVELLTPWTLLVPRELFDPAAVEALFAAHGLPLPAGMRVVQASGDGPTLAVMAAPEEAMQELERRCGAKVRYTTPLLHPVAATEPTVWICDTGELLYIRIYRTGLQLAETVAVGTEAGRGYLLERLAERIDPKEFVLQLEDRAGNARYYRNFFKKMLCE